MPMRAWTRTAAAALLAAGATMGAADEPAGRHAYFGDLHVHTLYSFDAFVFGIRTTPDDAYRYARGAPLPHPAAGEIRLGGPPLDFLAVTDHAEYLGVIPELAAPAQPECRRELAALLNSPTLAEVMQGHSRVARGIVTGEADPNLDDVGVQRATWQDIVAAAERHYRPGEFTTFVGFEYTPHPGANLHRNVIFRGARVPEAPFGALQSLDPEDLWSWLDGLRADGVEAMAIPHNANWSNGAMFALTRSDGALIDAAYAAQRARNEPLIEITQTKGTSETHPLLSPNDEWAGFELFGDRPSHLSGVSAEQVRLPGSYGRQALLDGLAMAARSGFNPYRFGFVGSSDTHNTGGSFVESDYAGKLGIRDGTPPLRGSVPLPVEDAGSAPVAAAAAQQLYWGSGGLAGVWATENTREALYDAMRRGETFATSGPRIRIRLLAGYGLPADLLDRPGGLDRAQAQGAATPMGGELRARAEAPELAVWALRDPASAGLERLQIVKLWVRDGVVGEQVVDVACAGGHQPDPATGRCPATRVTVDLADCSQPAGAGAAELKALWRDPEHRPEDRALYYARVIEHPTCRWSTWDAVRAGLVPNPAVPATIQERAWSSPVWLLPVAHRNR
ncbi:MAG: DUF3604 domain-containing protein [Pseudomonadales bacterium]